MSAYPPDALNEHTPGPWSLFAGVDTTAVCIGLEANGRRPCIVDWQGFDGNGLSLAANRANARLIVAAPDMHAILDALEDAFDPQIEPEMRRHDYDPPDDCNFTVNITAKQWRAIGRALNKAQRG